MNELVMRTRWARAAQMIFMATALFGSGACSQFVADTVDFTGPDTEGTSLTGVRSELRCKAKDMMIGVNVHRGSWIESIAVSCAALESDGTLSAPDPALAEPKNQEKEDYSVACEDREFVGALKARHDSRDPRFILHISVGCASIPAWKSSGVPDYTSFNQNLGESESEPPPLTCKPHDVAAGMNVWVDDNHVTNYSLYCIQAP